MRSTAAFVIFALCILAQAAHAAPFYTWWSGNAAGCAAGDPAIQNNRYLITAGSVKHQSTNVDLISLYCHVNPFSVQYKSIPSKLWITYRDSTGSASNLTYVTASLIRMNRSNGAITTIVTFSSDNFVDTGDAVNNVGFSHFWDFDTYVYYIRVDLKRNTVSDTVILYAVALGSR